MCTVDDTRLRKPPRVGLVPDRIGLPETRVDYVPDFYPPRKTPVFVGF